MPPVNPIEFMRRLVNNKLQHAGNRVQLEDATGLPYDAANPLPIQAPPGAVLGTVGIDQVTPNANNVAADLNAGEDHVGQVGGDKFIANAVVGMTAAGAYAIADFVGINATPLEFTIARINGGSGTITGAILIDKALQSLPLEIWLFDETVTPPNDNAPWTISDADAAKCIGIIPINTYYANVQNSVGISTVYSYDFKCGAATRKIYGAIVTRGAPTYANNDLIVRLKGSID